MSTEIEQVGAGNADGTRVGVVGGKIAFYGSTPAAQQATQADVATTDLTTTGILAIINAFNTLLGKLKTLNLVASA